MGYLVEIYPDGGGYLDIHETVDFDKYPDDDAIRVVQLDTLTLVEK